MNSKTAFEAIEKFRNSKVKYRKCSYRLRGNKGRPRKDDFITLPLNKLRDYMTTEILMNGFTTHYTYE